MGETPPSPIFHESGIVLTNSVLPCNGPAHCIRRFSGERGVLMKGRRKNIRRLSWNHGKPHGGGITKVFGDRNLSSYRRAFSKAVIVSIAVKSHCRLRTLGIPAVWRVPANDGILRHCRRTTGRCTVWSIFLPFIYGKEPE